MIVATAKGAESESVVSGVNEKEALTELMLLTIDVLARIAEMSKKNLYETCLYFGGYYAELIAQSAPLGLLDALASEIKKQYEQAEKRTEGADEQADLQARDRI